MPFVKKEENIEYNSKYSLYSTNEEISKNNNYDAEFKTYKPIYSLEDMILPLEIKEKIKDVIYSRQFKNKIFDEWGLGVLLPEFKNKLAVNLYGEPGTGKTMAANAIAYELNRELLKINYAEIESKYVGETAKNLERVFKVAKEKNAIIFFDEADALLSKRVTNMNNSTDVSVNQTRSVLLMLMNTYDDIILFTTNFINNFDEAFMRRIQFHIKFDLPNEMIRKLLWTRYIPTEMPNLADIDVLARQYEQVSGSDIANAVMMAAFTTVRRHENFVKDEYFHEAIKNIIQSKNANKNNNNVSIINERFVTKQYVDSKLGL